MDILFRRLLPLLALLLFAACDGGTRTSVLTAHGEPEVVVMDFSAPFSLASLPAGWYHRKFWTRAAMQLGFATKDGVPAIRCETRSSGSMLFRHIDFDLAEYPVLTWRWFVEQGIDSLLDETTRAGDDHPARLFLAFKTAAGEERRMEIIWGNRLTAGDYKFIGQFPHYVANGGEQNIGRWHSEELDLRPVYRHIWPDGAPARLIDIALFCDSDDTHTRSVAYFADVKLKRARD